MLNTQNTHTVTTTQNNNVKHASFVSVMQAQAQNKANAVLYTQQQLQQAQALAQAVQAQYFNKKVYKNLRKHFIAIKVANASICTNLLIIAKQHNAQVVATKCNSVVLRICNI
jgi:uncharacterized protein YaaR (DUF327 family)